MPYDLPADPAPAADERTTLENFLDFNRTVALRKLDGLTREQAVSRPTVSSLGALSIVKHLAYVERWWFQYRFAGRDVHIPWLEEHDAELRIDPGDTVEGILAFYEEMCADSRLVTRAADSLEATASRTGHSLRWILVHMVEETARHCGHLDLIRETIDGATGD